MLSLLFEPAVVLREAGVLSLSTSEAQGWLKSISFFMFPLPASPLSSLVYSYIIVLHLPLRYLLSIPWSPFLFDQSILACLHPSGLSKISLSILRVSFLLFCLLYCRSLSGPLLFLSFWFLTLLRTLLCCLFSPWSHGFWVWRWQAAKQLGVVHWIEISLRRPRRPHSYSFCAVPYRGSTCCALPCFGHIHEFRHSNDLHGLHHLSPYGRCGYSVEAEGGRDGGREGGREIEREGERERGGPGACCCRNGQMSHNLYKNYKQKHPETQLTVNKWIAATLLECFPHKHGDIEPLDCTCSTVTWISN